MFFGQQHNQYPLFFPSSNKWGGVSYRQSPRMPASGYYELRCARLAAGMSLQGEGWWGCLLLTVTWNPCQELLFVTFCRDGWVTCHCKHPCIGTASVVPMKRKRMVSVVSKLATGDRRILCVGMAFCNSKQQAQIWICHHAWHVHIK